MDVRDSRKRKLRIFTTLSISAAKLLLQAALPIHHQNGASHASGIRTDAFVEVVVSVNVALDIVTGACRTYMSTTIQL